MSLELYCFGESGNSYKVALTMTLAGLEWEPHFIDFFNGEARSEPFREINPMGEVPVLIDNGEVITQSGVILAHVAAKAKKFNGSSPKAQKEVWRWILWDNHKLSGQVGTCRFLMNFVAAEKRPDQVIQFLQNRLKNSYTVLNNHLEGRDWVADDGPTIADFSCCGYLYYPEPFGFVRADWPNIDRWLSNISALPDWQHPYDLMPGNPSDRDDGPAE